MPRLALLGLVLALPLAAGCAPALATAASTPSGQQAIDQALQRALARAGFRPETPLPGAPAPDSLVAGPMLADVTPRTATVWVQAGGPAEVRVRYAAVSGPSGEAVRALPRETTAVPADAEGVAAVVLPDLEPGWTYAYTVLLNGTEVARPYPTTVRAQPLWQWRTDPPAFTAAVGSCYYANDPAYDRPGEPYGGPPSAVGVFEQIRAQRPDLMVWLGDNVYLREVDWWSRAGIAYRYRHGRAEPALQPLLAAAAHYATWDDHDFGPNDSNRSYVLKEATLNAFRRYWPNPSAGMPGVPGVFTQFQWADAEFFLLDDRYHRAPNTAPLPERQLLGPEQMQWLLDALTTSQAPFKFVAFGGQVLPPEPSPGSETYVSVAPAERARLLAELARRRIEGVVFLSGDVHHTELMRLDREGAYPLYEFTSSPLTAGPASERYAQPNALTVDGTMVTGTRGFGTLAVSGPRTDRVLTLRAFDAGGGLRWERTVRQRDLRYPAAQ